MFSVIALKNIHLDSFIEIASFLFSMAVLCFYPVFFYWLHVANAKPTDDHITVDKQRELFAIFKLENKIMVLFNPLRKLVMVTVVVVLQNYPVWQIISLLILSFIKLLILTVYQPLKKRGQNIM